MQYPFRGVRSNFGLIQQWSEDCKSVDARVVWKHAPSRIAFINLAIANNQVQKPAVFLIPLWPEVHSVFHFDLSKCLGNINDLGMDKIHLETITVEL